MLVYDNFLANWRRIIEAKEGKKVEEIAEIEIARMKRVGIPCVRGEVPVKRTRKEKDWCTWANSQGLI